MRNKLIYDYSGISSFEDFRLEKERLKLKRQIVEARLNIDYLNISRIFSAANLILPFAREYLFPRISDLIGTLLGKTETDKNP
jgi:hypothetical protein